MSNIQQEPKRFFFCLIFGPKINKTNKEGQDQQALDVFCHDQEHPDAEELVHGSVTARLEDCSSPLLGCPRDPTNNQPLEHNLQLVQKLQLVQNLIF